MHISIVMTYFNRRSQLIRTLQTISQSAFKDFDIVIVDDNSENELILDYDLPIKVIRITPEQKTWTDRDVTTNIGIHEALKSNPDIVVLQNAECYHVGDVLKYASKIDGRTYISFSCYSIGIEATMTHGIFPLLDKAAGELGDYGWYNHPVYRATGYDFCAAITTKNLIKLNGHDERFAFGIGYDDDYFIRRVKNLGLTIDMPTDPYVVHQWHYTAQNMAVRTEELVKKNFDLFNSLKEETNYRAVHLITENFD